MGNTPGINGGLDNWSPSSGSTSTSQNRGLLATEAKDNPDSINGTNELKRFQGKAKKPSGPLGAQGQEF
jgi:hypothetical protein